MSKKINKRFILTDESINRYGFRVLSGGITNLDQWKKNPVILWMHYRDEGSKNWGYRPIGHWEDIELNDKGELSAVPVFDLVDDTSKMVCAKVEEGTLNACSIGFRIIETSEDPSVVLQGQTRATVTKWELMEASIVDIPANGNAVRMYDDNSLTLLSAHESSVAVPLLNQSNNSPMKLKASFAAILAFLGLTKERVEAEEVNLSEEDVTRIDAEMSRLRAELDASATKITDLETSHAAALAAKDNEIATLSAQVADLTTQNQSLNEQVTALKASPAPSQPLAPAAEPAAAPADASKQFLDFAEKNPDDTIGQMAKMKELGFV